MKLKLTSFLILFTCGFCFNVHARIDNGDTSDTADHLIGDTACPWGEVDCNPCVSNVQDNFENISDNDGDHTDNIKLRMEANDDSGELMCLYTSSCELSLWHHIQGMARIPNVDDNNWFVFTRSVKDGPGAFFSGQLTDMISAGGHLGAAEDEDDSARQITEYYTMDTLSPDPTTTNHYGGLQTLGKYVVTATDCDHNADSYDCSAENTMVYIYDFSDPTNVSVVSALNTKGDIDGGTAAAMTRLYNGNYLLVVNRSRDYFFYISDSNTLSTSTSWSLREQWMNDEDTVIDGGLGDTTWDNYQNFNIVTECETGDIYMIGTVRDEEVILSGPDWMDLFKLSEDTDSNVEITKYNQKHMYCDWCNMDSSGNIYITPENNMVLYASLHDDADGIDGTGDIRFEEFQNALNECNGEDDPDCDYDDDGLINSDEDSYLTSRYDSDTDDDGLSDGEEVHDYETDPLDSDSDDEGLLDGEEVNDYNTDPNNPDTDGDSLDDKTEIDNELDPNDASDATADDDADGLTNADEILIYGTDIHDADTDDDNLSDGYEVLTFGSNPLDIDSDDDGLDDDKEDLAGSDPNDTDTDDDSLSDSEEVYIYATDPADSDSDNDGLSDGDEINIHATDPNDDDSDNDGLLDGQEINTYGSDPNSRDSDDDNLDDGDEVSDYGTDPANSDTDGDGLSDGEEILTYGTSALDADTDDDEWSDYEEVNASITKDPLKFDNLIAQTFQHDFNGDGFSDLVAFYPEGEFYVILSDGDEFVDSGFWISGLGDYTSIPFTGDFNNDGKDDVAVMNPEDGTVQIGFSDGTSFVSDGAWVGGYDEDSTRDFVGDFDDDGSSDILTFDSNAGEVYVALASGSGFDSEAKWLISFGYDSPFQFVGEFDGNDQTDFIAYQSDGTFEVATSLGDSFDDEGTRGNSFPTNTTQMAAGDFNGDCLIDVVGVTVLADSPSWQTSTWDVFASNGTSFIDEGSWEISDRMSSTRSGCGGSEDSGDSDSSTGSGKYPFQQFIPIKIIDVINKADDDNKDWEIIFRPLKDYFVKFLQ